MLIATTYEPVIRLDLSRTILGRGRYWTTAYLVGNLLVDSGCAHSAKALSEFLQNRMPGKIFNTHSHEDHIGGNGRLQSGFPDLDIFAHPLGLPVLAEPQRMQPLQPYRLFMWGWPEPSIGKPVVDGDVICDGEMTFHVIATPGHADDHLCLYEPGRKWLFSGDLFVGGMDRALLAGADIWAVISSLKKILALPVTCLFPGSARVRENPRDDLLEKVGRLEDMGAKTLDLFAKGWKVDAIARTLFGSPLFIEFVTLGHFSRRNLVRSYLRNVIE